jgi:hypothetical protein
MRHDFCMSKTKRAENRTPPTSTSQIKFSENFIMKDQPKEKFNF